MSFWLGVILFAFGIGASIMLHEAGHMLTAKRFGMKVTHYFVGFGPTLWSFRRGETEYGVKAVPAGGFVKIVGMTPLETVEPGDEPRAFWRAPTWKRTIVLSAGSLTHFALGALLLYACAVFAGLPNPALADTAAEPAVLGEVTECVVPGYDLGPNGALRDCRAGDPVGPARAAGLLPGDRIVSFAGRPTPTYQALVRAIRGTPPGPTQVRYVRAGDTRTVTITTVAARRPPLDAPAGSTKLDIVSAIGVAPRRLPATVTYGPLAAVPRAADFAGQMFTGTFSALAKFPAKVPKLVDALLGQSRDPETPISVVGASRVGGQAVEAGSATLFLFLLAGLNVFIGVFNLFPLLPLDGGHIAIAWFERARTWLARRRGRPDPGRVDYLKLLPVTYAVTFVFIGVSVLAIAADIVNPIANPFRP